MVYTIVGMVVPWLLVGIGAWLLFELLRSTGRTLLRLESLDARMQVLEQQASAESKPKPPPPPREETELPLGSVAPSFELPDFLGLRRSLSEFKGRRVLLIFFNPHCGFCLRMAETVSNLPWEGPDSYALPLLVSTGAAADNRSMVDEYGVRCPLVLQQEMEIASLYRCHGTPMGYLVDEQGQIASAKAVGADALLALIRSPSLPATTPTNNEEPCDKAKPCGKCKSRKGAESVHEAIEGSSNVTAPVNPDDQPYDIADLRGQDSVETMTNDLTLRAEQSVRLIILYGSVDAPGISGTEAAALRRFLRQHHDWVVSYQPNKDRRFLLVSRDLRDRKPLPSIFTKAANFAKALSVHVADGASKVDSKQLELRLEECLLCDRRSGDHCSACGCDLLIKSGWRTSKCPLGKWPTVEETEVHNSVSESAQSHSSRVLG